MQPNVWIRIGCVALLPAGTAWGQAAGGAPASPPAATEDPANAPPTATFPAPPVGTEETSKPAPIVQSAPTSRESPIGPALANTGSASGPVTEPHVQLSAPATPNEDGIPPADLRVAGHLGGFGSGDGGGLTVGATFQYRAGVLAGGALLETGQQIFGYSSYGIAAIGGFDLRPLKTLRLELLAAIGAHAYDGVGRDWLFGSDPGAHGSTAYAGGRAGISYLFGRGRGHFEIGAYGDFQDDLTRSRVRYGGGTSDHVIGASRLGFGLELGGTHDIL